MQPTEVDIVLLFLILAGGAWGVLAGAVRVAAPFAAILAVISLIHAYPEISTRFGANATAQLFGLLLLALIGVVIFGFVTRILHSAVRASGLGPVNRLLGLGLGLATGALLGGAVAWGLETHGGVQGTILLRGSMLMPAVKAFFEAVMGLTHRMFPPPEPTVPWWRRPWW